MFNFVLNLEMILNLIFQSIILNSFFINLNHGGLLLNDLKRKPLLIISIDGLRSISFNEFLSSNPESKISKYFIKEGVLADFMLPSFPTVTYPNHFSLATGNKLIGNYPIIFI